MNERTHSAVMEVSPPIAPMSPVPQPASASVAMIQMIERALRDPSVDMDKMERLLAMKERFEAGEAEQAFHEAMAACQAKMRTVSADASNPQTKSRYASYAALDRVLRPIYTDAGFDVTFNTAPGAPEGHVRVTARVTKGKHGRDYQIDMPADGKGAKGGDVMTKTHATGSAVTYGRRYLLLMIFNIAVGDDDGNAAGTPTKTVSDEQVQAISDELTKTKSDLTKFLKRINCESLTAIRADRFDDVMKLIRDVAAKRQAKEAKQ